MYSARVILSQSNGSTEKVCRNLFGPVDHERLKADYESQLNSLAEEAKEKWNFDFVTETPLEGAFKWEKVDCVNGDYKRKHSQSLITDYFQVKRHCSPGPSLK